MQTFAAAVSTLREAFPTVSTDVIIDVLQANEGDIDRATDALVLLTGEPSSRPAQVRTP